MLYNNPIENIPAEIINRKEENVLDDISKYFFPSSSNDIE
jgi:inhibitor of KinA sporulation pathway (predicted exonuclease)